MTLACEVDEDRVYLSVMNPRGIALWAPSALARARKSRLVNVATERNSLCASRGRLLKKGVNIETTISNAWGRIISRVSAAAGKPHR